MIPVAKRAISPEEMEKKVRKYLPELFMSELEKIKVTAENAAVAVVNQIIEHPEMKSMNTGGAGASDAEICR